MATVAAKTTKTTKLCSTCGVNKVEYQDDDECAWCREKRQREEGAL